MVKAIFFYDQTVPRLDQITHALNNGRARLAMRTADPDCVPIAIGKWYDLAHLHGLLLLLRTLAGRDQPHHAVPHHRSARVGVVVGIPDQVHVGPQLEAVQDDARALAMQARMASTSASSRSSGAQISTASWIRAQTSIPCSVAKQAASRSISAPFAGKENSAASVD